MYLRLTDTTYISTYINTFMCIAIRIRQKSNFNFDINHMNVVHVLTVRSDMSEDYYRWEQCLLFVCSTR